MGKGKTKQITQKMLENPYANRLNAITGWPNCKVLKKAPKIDELTTSFEIYKHLKK